MQTQNQSQVFSNNSFWFMEIVIGLCALGAIYFVFQKVVKYIRQRSLSTTHGWKDKIGEITFLPFTILLWVLGGILVLEVLSKRFQFLFFDDYLDPFRTSAIVICIGWLLLRWKAEAQKMVLDRERHVKKIDASFVHVLGKLLTIVVVWITSMIVLQLWGVNLGPLIAFGGIGAAAIGFAAKDVIGNFFGGLMLHVTRPFMNGDYVLLPDKNLEGHVEEIGWYLTAIRDKEKRPVYLPNAIFSSALVINGSRMTHRRILETIGIRYADFGKLKDVCAEIQAAIKTVPSIDSHLPVLVHFNHFGGYALEIIIDVYTLVTRYDQYLGVRQEVLSKVYEVILAKEVELPMPTFDLNVRSDSVAIHRR